LYYILTNLTIDLIIFEENNKIKGTPTMLEQKMPELENCRRRK
jgi:hypothetical protein